MIKEKISNFFKTIFPANLQELLVFFVFLSIYSCFAAFIAFNYRIVFDDRIPWDAYFSFDNRSIVMTGGGFERHPLSNYFFDRLRQMALMISDNKKDEIFRLVLSLFSSLSISFSVLQVFKYLRNIIQLPLYLSWVLVVFFGLFSTNILLSFTPETYTYTLFLLCLYNYYSALKLKNNSKIPVSSLALANITIGGLTITNAVKVFIPIVFERQLFSSWKNFGKSILKALASVIVFVLLYLNRLNFNWHRIFEKTGEQYEKFSKPKSTPIWDMICSWFFGGNVLFSNFVIRDYHSKIGFKYKALFMHVFSSDYLYVFVLILLLLLAWSWFVNRKNRLVNILILSFMVDIAIHCILKFGLHTSYIYGGHFVFVYPLLLGWLLSSVEHKKPVFIALFGLLCVMLVFLTFNNIYRMQEFIEFLNVYYK